MLYCFCHRAAVAGEPVTMPASWQYVVCCKAGASWPVVVTQAH